VAGRRRRAALFGVPAIATSIVVVGGLVFIPTARLIAIALDPATVAVLFLLQTLLLAWRAAASGSSLVDGRFPRLGRRDALPIAILAVVLIAPQAFAAYATEVAREATDQIIPIDPTTAGAWDPSASASAVPDPEVILPSEVPGSPSITPSASPSPAVPRQNVLLVGVDAGIGRNTYLTDTMIVASLDPVTQTVSMISIPRDMVDVPLPDRRKFSGKINSLVSFARHHQATFPGSNGDGYDVLMGALGTLLGLRIDHYASVNLGGFVAVVDTLGGIDVDVAEGFCDPTYDEYGFTHGFGITAGRHHLNGQQALGYARIRKAAGESDFTRAARQQEILSGIRDRVKAGGFLNDPIGLIKALSDTVQTNIPRSLVPDLADMAIRIGRKQDLWGGHHPPARQGRLRQPWQHPGPRRGRDPDAPRRTVPSDRNAAARSVPGARLNWPRERVRRQQLRPGRDPTTDGDPEADLQAHGQTECERPADADADADAQPDP
jgi:LCP family protein required for cell wall assembly